ncbi:unnamed protein product [Nezara viridula]|uniref:Uncharacterized protein n=1 Tax=Nezara viridula TaxID=85310 RepID=A0A9P0HPG9_NEZVI|nr:unnamed protein product [Nezara viridula]
MARPSSPDELHPSSAEVEDRLPPPSLIRVLSNKWFIIHLHGHHQLDKAYIPHGKERLVRLEDMLEEYGPFGPPDIFLLMSAIKSRLEDRSPPNRILG